MQRIVVFTALLLIVSCVHNAHAREAHRQVRPWKTKCMLVFGDSTVDAGNNNRLSTTFKANFLPYGKDFFDGRPTGRFSDGRLASDFIAEFLGISTSVPAFLDPNLTSEQLKHGVSFGSASSGYDELTSTSAGVISMAKQVDYLKHYKLHLRNLFGPAEAQKITEDATVVISAGTNDFIQNYYFYDNRSKEFTEPQYEDYLVSLISEYIKEINKLGPKRFTVVGVPPMGCLPVVKTLMSAGECYVKLNDVAKSFNSKIARQLHTLRKQLSIKAAFLDVYQVFEQATKHPKKFGFTDTTKGCCGSGMIEIGATCKGQTTCDDPTRFMYWDAVHPTQKMYKLIAEVAIQNIGDALLV